jgi:hypothetical protein
MMPYIKPNKNANEASDIADSNFLKIVDKSIGIKLQPIIIGITI